MTAGDIIALAGVGVAIVGPAYAAIWHRLAKLEAKLSDRAGDIYRRLEDFERRNADEHRAAFERLAALEAQT